MGSERPAANAKQTLTPPPGGGGGAWKDHNCGNEMKWRNDRRSERNLCHCLKRPEKNSGLQRGLNPWPRDCRCDALPTELWSHWYQVHKIRERETRVTFDGSPFSASYFLGAFYPIYRLSGTDCKHFYLNLYWLKIRMTRTLLSQDCVTDSHGEMTR